MLKQSVVLLIWLLGTKAAEMNCLTQATIKTFSNYDENYDQKSYAFFKISFPGLLLSSAVISSYCLVLNWTSMSVLSCHYIQLTPHMMELHFLTRYYSSPIVMKFKGSFPGHSNKHSSIFLF